MLNPDVITISILLAAHELKLVRQDVGLMRAISHITSHMNLFHSLAV